MAKEKSFDSTKHHEDRKAKIQEENRQNEAEAKETAEDKEIADFSGPVKDGETRDQLLERIHKMRAAPPKEPEPELVRSEGLQKQFEAEQQAGQEAVARAKAEMDRYLTLVEKAEVVAGEKKSTR